MENIGYILFAGLVVSLASLTGVLLVKSNKNIALFIENNLMLLTSLSGGIFLFTSTTMVTETIHILSLEKSFIAFLIGMILFILLQKIINSHRHKGGSHEHTHAHDKISAIKILIGDAIHNIADGLFLVASFGTNIITGISTTISVFLHEVPQEISEFIVLRKSGYSIKEASYKNFITALSIFIGIGVGIISMKTETMQGYLIGISSIFFIGVVFTDLFPLKTIFKEKERVKTTLIFILGFLLMGTIMHFLGH
jgi:zinc transporter ZupT